MSYESTCFQEGWSMHCHLDWKWRQEGILRGIPRALNSNREYVLHFRNSQETSGENEDGDSHHPIFQWWCIWQWRGNLRENHHQCSQGVQGPNVSPTRRIGPSIQQDMRHCKALSLVLSSYIQQDMRRCKACPAVLPANTAQGMPKQAVFLFNKQLSEILSLLWLNLR